MKKWIKKIVAGFTAAAIMFGSAGLLPEGVFDSLITVAGAEPLGNEPDIPLADITKLYEGTVTIDGVTYPVSGITEPEIIRLPDEEYDSIFGAVPDTIERIGNNKFAAYKHRTNYYYDQLSPVDKQLFDNIEMACENYYQTGKGNITNYNGKIYLGNIPFNRESNNIKKVMFAFRYSCPRYFFLSGGWTWSSNKFSVALEPAFENSSELFKYKNKIDKLTEEWVGEAQKLEEDLDKEIYICTKMIDHISYGFSTYHQTIAGGLADAECVCAGYARTAQYLLTALGIDCIYVTCPNHAWNMVKLYDNWYCLDVTWLDPLGDEMDFEHTDKKWFNKSYETFRTQDTGMSHTVDADYADYGFVLPSCTREVVTKDNVICTVSFVNEGGEAVPAQRVAWGLNIEKPELANREGYRFGGWFTEPGYINQYNFEDIIRKDLTLYARWTAIKPGDSDLSISEGYLFLVNGISADIVIPEDVIGLRYTYFGNFMGYYTENIYVSPENKYLDSIDGVLFSKDHKTLLAYPMNAERTEYTIPSGTEIIAKNAFYNAGNLVSVTIPYGVTVLDEYAFSSCKKLKTITLPDSLIKIDNYAFSYDIFEEIIVPESVKTIGMSAFSSNSKLKNAVINADIKEIDSFMFSNCSSLERVTIPAVKNIKWYAFTGCNALTELCYAGTEAAWKKVDISSSAGIPDTCRIVFLGKKTPDKISIAVAPTKTIYEIGEQIDISGCKILITYDDDSEETVVVTTDMISGFDSEKIGEQVITVTLKDLATEFIVKVKPPKEVTSISVNVPNNPQKPIEGSALDLTGYTLTVKYDDKSTDTIALTANMVTGYDANKIGKQRLTVEYSGKTTTFEVTVLPDPKNMPVIVNGEGYDTLTNALKAWKSGDLDITINKSLTYKTVTIPKTVTSATITTAPGAVLTLSTPTITANCNLTLDAVVAAEKANAKAFTVKTIADKTVTINRLETALPITLSGTKTSNFVLNTGSTLNLVAAATINVEITAGTIVKLDGGKFTPTTLSGAGKLDVYGASTVTLANAQKADITLNKYEKTVGKTTTVNLQKLTLGTVGAVTLTVKEPAGTLSNISGQTVIALAKQDIIPNLETKITITNTANGKKLSAVQYKKDVRAEYLDALTVVGLQNFSSFEKAFEAMTDTTANYTVRLNEDTSLAKLTLPKQIGSLSIDGNNKTLTLTGVTSIAPKYGLTLKNINITAVTAKGAAAALAVNVTTGNAMIDGLNFNGKTLTIKGGKDNVLTLGECSEIYSLTGFAKVNITDDIAISKTFTANDVKLGASANLTLMSGAALKINRDKAMTADTGATITLVKGFTPIDLTGSLATNIKLVSATTLEDQPIFKTKADLKGVYDLSGIAPDNGLEYALLTSGQYAYLKAYTIDVNGVKYAFWDDVVKAITSKTTDYTIKLLADVNIGAALKLPAASKCKSLTIDGNGHSLTFIGTSVSVSLPLTLKDITVTALNKKTLAETAWTLRTNGKLTETGNVVLTDCTKK